MLKKIKELYLNRAFLKNKRKHRFLSMESIKNIIILFDYKDITDIIFIIQDLEKLGKKVVAWTTSSNEMKDEYKISFKKIRVLKSNEYSNIYLLKKEIIFEFKKLKYDTLIDFRREENLQLDYLLAINQAVFCVGTKKYPNDIFNLLILQKTGKRVFETYEDIRKYLLMIEN